MYLADLHIHSKYSRAAEVVKEFGLQCPPRRFLNEVSAYKNGKGECNQAIAAYCARLREREK